MQVTRMSDGVVLDAIFEDRGCETPGYDSHNRSFPAWTAYFECGELCFYHQVDLRILNGSEELAARGFRETLNSVGFEAGALPSLNIRAMS